jgi:hypothetical protein
VPYLKADRSFDRTALNQVVRSFLGLAEGNQGAIEFETLPWTGGPNQGGQQVLYLQQPDADAVLARLRTFGEKSSSTASNSSSTTAGTNRVSPHDVTVRVLNATQIAGAAGNAEAALVKLGFVSGGTGNDPRVLIDHSEIRYGPNALAKAQLLAGYVADAKLVPDATISGADVVLVLGRSFNRIAATTTLPATTAPASSGAATSTTSAAQAACK